MDHLFSLYIKSMGKDTVYRVEERKHPHQSPLDFINNVFNPSEKVEKLISEFREEQKQLAGYTVYVQSLLVAAGVLAIRLFLKGS
jgi:hypothetical protein